MASSWGRKWSRLTRMRWDEIRTRAGQEVCKRADLALYQFGQTPWNQSVLQPDPSSYSFLGDEKDLARKTELLREHLPGEVGKIIEEADRICRHEFHLLGFEHLQYGSEIDWHSDPVHGKRSLLKPWFKINFLDFHQVGDHKMIWEINRHQHLVTLAKAWRLTGRLVYIDELVQQWYSWQKANPYPLGINWASALEVAFRSLSWLWVRELLPGCEELPATFKQDLLSALQLHGRYIHRYLSTYFSPNTHLLGEAVALFFLGTLCRQLKDAERWRNQGWKIVVEQSRRQVRADGVYFEQALYYHVYALDFFLHARQLAALSEIAAPDNFDHTIQNMLQVVGALSASGAIEAFGDDDGGRVFNPRRNRTEHLIDPLALGSILYDRDRHPAATLTEEAIWLFGDRAVRLFDKPREQTSASSRAFEAGGLYVINDAVSRAQMMIDAGPQGIGHSGHGHADALSIRLSIEGKRFLVDPGTYCYISDTNDRDAFRGTAAHNTLTVDGLDQAVPDGPFAWNAIPTVQCETWLNGRSFDYFVGSHDGYRRLQQPVLHRRAVFHSKGGLWLVRDVAEGNGTHRLETHWHFAPDLALTLQENAVVAAPRTGTAVNESGSGLALLFDRDSTAKLEIGDGFVSPAYGSKQSAPVARSSITAALPHECAVLLLSQTEATTGTFEAVRDTEAHGVCGYRYATPHGAETIFFGNQSSPWTCGAWSSDASVLYCKYRAGRLAHVIMISGSFAAWNGRRFVSHPSTFSVFEWWEGVGESGSPAETVAPDALVADFEIS